MHNTASWAFGKPGNVSAGVNLNAANDHDKQGIATWISIRIQGGKKTLIYRIPLLQRFDILRQRMLKLGMKKAGQYANDNYIVATYLGATFKIQLENTLCGGEFPESNKYVLYLERR